MRKGHTDSFRLFLKHTRSVDGHTVWIGNRFRVFRYFNGEQWVSADVKTYLWNRYRAPLRKGYRIVPTCGHSECINPDHMKILPPVATIAGILARTKKNKATGCWIWQHAHTKGRAVCSKKINGSKLVSHLVLKLFYNKTVYKKKGQLALHTCDNPMCVNPKHLYIGTIKNNAEDMVRKERSLRGESNPGAVLTEGQVLDIYNKYHNEGYRFRDVCALYTMVSPRTINKIIYGERWNHITRHR